MFHAMVTGTQADAVRILVCTRPCTSCGDGELRESPLRAACYASARRMCKGFFNGGEGLVKVRELRTPDGPVCLCEE